MEQAPIVSSVEDRIFAVEQRISDMNMQQLDKKTWYKDVSVLISTAAFAVSILTTSISAYKTYLQDIDSKKAQLRNTLFQVANLQAQMQEIYIKYVDNPKISNISSALNSQSVMLAKQAYSLNTALGSKVDTVDLINISYILAQTGEFILSEETANKAIANSLNSTEYISSHRQLGMLKYANGAPRAGRTAFEEAIEGFSRFPVNNSYYVNFTHANTYLLWANSAFFSDCQAAKESTMKGQAILENIPAHMRDASLTQSFFNLSNSLTSCK